jgi:diacylglycerol kinase (ATP)
VNRARLIANPTSGANRAAELLPGLVTRLRTIAADLDVALTNSAGETMQSAARAAADGCEAVFVAGGDGTINAALRGLLANDRRAAIPVGVIPLGTGNDFAKALDLGEDADAAVSALSARREVAVDVGLLNGRPFVNTSAGGFVADVSESVTEGLKDSTGKLAYLIGGVRALLGSEPFAARVRMHDPGSAPAWQDWQDVQMFAVCNGRFIGGGYPIAPEAVIDDGLLDVLVVPRLPRLEFVGVLQQIAGGKGHQLESVHSFRASAFDLELSHTIRVNTDGELLEASCCEYRVGGGALRFFCGPSPHAHARPSIAPDRRHDAGGPGTAAVDGGA